MRAVVQEYVSEAGPAPTGASGPQEAQDRLELDELLADLIRERPAEDTPVADPLHVPNAPGAHIMTIYIFVVAPAADISPRSMLLSYT